MAPRTHDDNDFIQVLPGILGDQIPPFENRAEVGCKLTSTLNFPSTEKAWSTSNEQTEPKPSETNEPKIEIKVCKICKICQCVYLYDRHISSTVSFASLARC